MNIEQIRTRLRELLAQRATHEQTMQTTLAAVTARGASATPDAAEQVTLRTERAAIVALDADLDQTQAALREALDEQTRSANAAALRAEMGDGTERQQGGARVQDARTYRPDLDSRGEVSFFVDAFRSTQLGDVNALQRLQRHADEVRVEGEAARERGQQTSRAVSTGSFGGLVIPQYLIGLAARVIRGGRPLANAVARLPLPEQGMSLIIPRGTTAATAASQATENSALSNTDEVWANLTVPVATIGGQQDVSRQTLERGTPGIDQIVYMDLAAQYHAELDRQVANGTGASGQMLGMFATAGIFTAAAFGAVVTGATLNTKVAGAVAAVAGVGVGVTPKLIAMHPRRWGFLTGLSDSTGRPLVTPNQAVGMNLLAANTLTGGYSGGDDQVDFRQAVPVGSMQGLPVITDANMPATFGTNSEDLIGAIDNDQCLLWEDGDGMPRQLRFEQTLGQNLTVKLIAYGYAAFTAGRYPQAVARVGGADSTATFGLVAPTF